MSKKRNKRNSKKFKKKLNRRNQFIPRTNPVQSRFNKSKRYVDKRVDELFGNNEIDINKMMFRDGWDEMNSVKRRETFKEGELEWEKKFRIMLNNKDEINKLFNFLVTEPSLMGQGLEVFRNIVKLNFYHPYELYGNKTKWWFSELYDWVSELKVPVIGTQGIQILFRVMEKNEFLNQLDNGVQGISWSPDFTNCGMWIRKHFWSVPNSENDKMVIVGSVFKPTDVIMKVNQNDNTLSDSESEFWVKKNVKPLQTFTLGEYGYDDFIGPMNKQKIEEKMKDIRTHYKETNGFIGTETKEKQFIVDNTDETKHTIGLRLFGKEIPNLKKKIMKCKLVNQQRKINNSLFIEKMENQLNYYIESSSKILENHYKIPQNNPTIC